MNKFFLKKLPFILALSFFSCFPQNLAADEIELLAGEIIQGIILSADQNEVAIQIDSDWRVFKRDVVVRLERWDEDQNDKLRSEWRLKGFWSRLKKAVKGGPVGILRFLGTYHDQLIFWVERTRVYEFVLRYSYFQKYRRVYKNRYRYC